MPRTKSGEKITWKEFMRRWKKGIEGITPLQQTKSQLGGMKVMIFGMLAGLVVSLTKAKTFWWLALILGGGLFNMIIQYIGLWQKKKLLESFEVSINTNERGEEQDVKETL